MYKKTMIYAPTLIIGFVVVMLFVVGIVTTIKFIDEVFNRSVELAEIANTISIKGSGDGITTNIFGHAVTFKVIGQILPEFENIKLIGKGLYFFVDIITKVFLNIVNNIIFM